MSDALIELIRSEIAKMEHELAVMKAALTLIGEGE